MINLNGCLLPNSQNLFKLKPSELVLTYGSGIQINNKVSIIKSLMLLIFPLI